MIETNKQQIEKLKKEGSIMRMTVIILAIVMTSFLILGSIAAVNLTKKIAKMDTYCNDVFETLHNKMDTMQNFTEKLVEQINCRDSDSGVNYQVIGICDDGLINRIDYCTDNILTEYYCAAGNIRVSGTKQVCLSNDVDCATLGSRCLNGRCMPSDTK